MILERWKFKSMVATSGENLPVTSQHGGGHHMARQKNHASSSFYSSFNKATNAIMGSPPS